MSYSDFVEKVLIALYQESQDSNDIVPFHALVEKYGLDAKPGWLTNAKDDLQQRGLVTGPRHLEIDDTAIGRITGAGLRYIEGKYGDKDGVGTLLEPLPAGVTQINPRFFTSEGPIPADFPAHEGDIHFQLSPSEPEQGLPQYEKIYRELVPASDRFVTPQHNSDGYADAVAKLEEARRCIDASNQIAGDEKDDALVHLDAGISVLKRAKTFAVGAIRYLILDRLKKAFEGAIEDAFKAVIVGACLALAVYILALL